MDSQQFADTYLMANAQYFPNDKIFLIKDKLAHLPEERQAAVQAVPLKNPIATLILSLLLGGLSIDRFYLGDIGLGILKFILVLLVIGGIWVLLDIYFCYKKSKEINFNNLMLVL